MTAYKNLVQGYKEFRKSYLSSDNEAYREKASQTQEPQAMVIACADSRVKPAILTNAKLGQFFSVNNVANIVPPYEATDKSHHAVGSAIQFAVTVLNVSHIVVMGHSGCGGIRALMEQPEDRDTETTPDDYITDWVSLVKGAKKKVLENHPDEEFDHQCTACEKQGALQSIEHLKTYPWVQKAIKENNLQLHAWWFDIESGGLYEHMGDKGYQLLADDD